MFVLTLLVLRLTLCTQLLPCKALDLHGSLLPALDFNLPVESLDSASCINNLKHFSLLGTLHSHVLIFQLFHILFLDREHVVLCRRPITGLIPWYWVI